MGTGTILTSVHKTNGWGGQYYRMIRWYKKFQMTDPGNFEGPNVENDHDILFACFQNIFYLKDWLVADGHIPKEKLNEFINNNLRLQICRDICNGTKHFEITNPSVDADFTIIREFNPLNEVLKTTKNRIIILTGGHKFELKKLAFDCIQLWDKFIRDNVVEAKRGQGHGTQQQL